MITKSGFIYMIIKFTKTLMYLLSYLPVNIKRRQNTRNLACYRDKLEREREIKLLELLF